METRQTIDLGLSRKHLETYLIDCGYWGNAHRRQRNTYVLSPCAYLASPRQRAQLERMAVRTHAAVRALSGELSGLALRHSLTNREARFLSLALSARRDLAAPAQVAGGVPPVIKVDLAQDVAGDYRIVEVDAYNPRGLGYFVLLDGSVPYGWWRLGPGIPEIAQLLRQWGRRGTEWFVVVSAYERYYETVFGLFCAALREQGIAARILEEPEVDRVLFETEHPHMFAVPETLGKEVSEKLVSLYGGRLQTFFPPAAYLGSKAFLPYLRTQVGMEEFIPPTSLVSKKDDPAHVCNGSPVVLKAAMSSGLKKVLFSDDSDGRFAEVLAGARQTHRPGWILQQQVPQNPVSVTVFDDSGSRVEAKYFLRITAYVAASGLIGAEVTGRPDTKVHGAPDCIQIPVVVE